MQMVIAETQGPFDLRCITVMGVNVKLRENPIGEFGTGWKYKIAVLLRAHQKISLQVGLDLYTFTSEPTEIRGKVFDLIYMTGPDGKKELSFTTELGKHWKMWMAYRELYSNTADEDGCIYTVEEIPEPRENYTRVIIEGDAFLDKHLNRKSFILQSEAFLSNDILEVHRGLTRNIFYRGIKVYENNNTFLYTYNFLEKMSLTEDRTLSYSFEIDGRLRRFIVASTDKTFLKTVLRKSDYEEDEISYRGTDESRVSKEFLEVVAEFIERGTEMNHSAKLLYQELTKKTVVPKGQALNQVETKMLEKAIDFCNGIGFPVDAYEIIVVESLGDGVLGQALTDNGQQKILLAHPTFSLGTKIVAGTLIEEHTHLRHGYSDCSRGLQDFFLNTLVGLGEQLNGEPL